MTHLIMMLTALVGTFAFTLIMRLERRHVLPATLAGVLVFGMYYLVYYFTADLFLSNFAGALLAAICAYFFAVLYRTPATVFHAASLIPLVPGGLLYRTMDALIKGNLDGFLLHGGNTLRVGLGIAAGIVLGGIAVRLLRAAHRH